MRTLLLLCVATATALAGYAQYTFQAGYLIGDDGDRVACLIKDVDWNSNPTTFEYKASPAGEVRTATLDEVREFGVDGSSKYVRATVAIDRSATALDKLDYARNPTLAAETLWLRTLVEGDATLYEYVDGNLRRFFLSARGAPVELLVYKLFRVSPTAVNENTQYRQQLWTALQHPPEVRLARVTKVAYRREDLASLIEDYNQATGGATVTYATLTRADLLHVRVKPGVSSVALAISNEQAGARNVDFGRGAALRVGVELELVMPFNRGRWSLFTEPTYQHLRADGRTGPAGTAIRYSVVELPLGLRHYFVANGRSRLFANVLLVKDLAVGSSIDYARAADLDVRTNTGLAAGVGYRFRDRYSAEARYYANRNILSAYQFWRSDYTMASIVFGYTIL